MLTIDPPDRITRNRSSVQKFRSGKHRYDFYAAPEMRQRIERLRDDYPTLSASDVINDLLEAGYMALFPVRNR